MAALPTKRLFAPGGSPVATNTDFLRRVHPRHSSLCPFNVARPLLDARQTSGKALHHLGEPDRILR
jgi:hypothetical protein